jgi:cysteinyl-tRNA synthetase
MLSLYNTLTKKKEAFESLHPGKASVYTCGPTVYDYQHLGNFRAYVFADTLRRVLVGAGYEVRHIVNITDVGHLTEDDTAQGDRGEDKIAKKAASEHKAPEEIANLYERYFLETAERLEIVAANYFPRATAHVPQMIKLIEELIARGHAYEANGNVFYDVTSFPEYGRLSGNRLEDLKVGARLEEHPDKRHPWDFALWLKAPKGHLMHWPSPWSEGYPGWHIECSAMALEYLGDTLDIHTGGEDHIFPHHEAEIAQSEGATGKPFARFFLHVRHMLIDGEKMSKSKGNFYRLEDVLERGFSPVDLRLLYLSSHYRSQMNFTWEALEQAKKNREALENAYARLRKAAFSADRDAFTGHHHFEAFRAALEDDLNTPLALSHLLAFVKEANATLDRGEPLSGMVLDYFDRMARDAFGLRIEAPDEDVPAAIQKLAADRERARADRDFAKADEARKEIEDAGYSVEDTPEGPVVRKK